MGRSIIEVEDYTPRWKTQFNELHARLWPLVGDIALSIEHVGSTSVEGLAAKPIIDVDIVVPAGFDLADLVGRLARLGYAHQGDLGIEGREAFREPEGSLPHNLYACRLGCLALRNHLLLRDYLRAHPQMRDAYGALKKSLAQQHRHSIGDYIAGKTAFIAQILQKQGLSADETNAIASLNLTTPRRLP